MQIFSHMKGDLGQQFAYYKNFSILKKSMGAVNLRSKFRKQGCTSEIHGSTFDVLEISSKAKQRQLVSECSYPNPPPPIIRDGLEGADKVHLALML